MIDRVDLLIAVIGIVASVMGSSTALWMAMSKKADSEDVRRLEDRLDAGLTRLESKLDASLTRLESKLDNGLTRVESKLDTLLILRVVPESPPPEN